MTVRHATALLTIAATVIVTASACVGVLSTDDPVTDPDQLRAAAERTAAEPRTAEDYSVTFRMEVDDDAVPGMEQQLRLRFRADRDAEAYMVRFSTDEMAGDLLIDGDQGWLRTDQAWVAAPTGVLHDAEIIQLDDEDTSVAVLAAAAWFDDLQPRSDGWVEFTFDHAAITGRLGQPHAQAWADLFTWTGFPREQIVSEGRVRVEGGRVVELVLAEEATAPDDDGHARMEHHLRWESFGEPVTIKAPAGAVEVDTVDALLHEVDVEASAR